MKVVSVLESLPGLGKVKARRLMETVGISDSRRLQGLGCQAARSAAQRDCALSPAGRAAHLRPHRPRRGRQGHAGRPAGRRGPHSVAEPQLDDPGAAARRGGARRLRLRRPRRRSRRPWPQGGFFEWAEFLGNLMGTPVPDPPPGSRRAARDRRAGGRAGAGPPPRRHRDPAAPALARGPGGAPGGPGRRRGAHRARRVELGRSEVRAGQAKIAAHTVVNDDLRQALAEVAAIVERHPSGCATLRVAGPADSEEP